MSEKEICFRLSRSDAGQIIDGLSVCLENWQKTLSWYDGKLEDPDFVILECATGKKPPIWSRFTRIYWNL